MFSTTRSSYLLKFYHRNLAKQCSKLIVESSQFSWKRSTSISLSQNLQCSSSPYNNRSDNLKEIKKPRSIRKYFAQDSFSSLKKDEDDTGDNVELSKPLKDDIPDATFSSEEMPSRDQDGWKELPSTTYTYFDKRSSPNICDSSEQQLGKDVDQMQDKSFEPSQPPKLFMTPTQTVSKTDISLERGKTGVFDLDDLVELLRFENGKDIVAMNIPAEMLFVDHMVVVSSNSQRHLNAIAASVRKHYNAKMSKKDKCLVLEGRDSDWVAMDLGNIALHIMAPSERLRIDLESLWLCGPEHDLMLQQVAKASKMEEEDLFFLVDTDPRESANVDPEAYDITKEYSHPFIPVYDHEVLPDYSEINKENINTYAATSVMEMALAKHNKGYARKFRGRFKK